MRPVQDFLANSSKDMVEYIQCVSSPNSSQIDSLPSQVLDRHERVRIMNALHQRHGKAPTLHREAIPLLPHMVDLPKHLAVVTSIVVRHTRRQLPTMTGPSTEGTFDEFCSSCLQIEEHALRRVSQLAARRRPQSMSTPQTPAFLNSPPSSPPTNPLRERKPSLPNKLRSKRSRRPSTTPEHKSEPQAKESSDDVSLPSSPAAAAGSSHVLARTVTTPITSQSLPPVEEPHSLPSPRAAFMRHPRSTSTDSALSRKQHSSPRQPSMPTVFPSDVPADSQDDSTRKTRGLFRGILRK